MPKLEQESIPLETIEIKTNSISARTILMVDDNDDLLHIGEEFIKISGHKPLTTNNPILAIDWLETKQVKFNYY